MSRAQVAERRRTREVSGLAGVGGVKISPNSVSLKLYSEQLGGGEVLRNGAATCLAGIRTIRCVGTRSIVVSVVRSISVNIKLKLPYPPQCPF